MPLLTTGHMNQVFIASAGVGPITEAEGQSPLSLIPPMHRCMCIRVYIYLSMHAYKPNRHLCMYICQSKITGISILL